MRRHALMGCTDPLFFQEGRRTPINVLELTKTEVEGGGGTGRSRLEGMPSSGVYGEHVTSSHQICTRQLERVLVGRPPPPTHTYQTIASLPYPKRSSTNQQREFGIKSLKGFECLICCKPFLFPAEHGFHRGKENAF